MLTNPVEEVEQHPAPGSAMGQLSSSEDAEMENVQNLQDSAAPIPRLGFNRTVSVSPSRHEPGTPLNPQGEPTTTNPQTPFLPARDSSGGKMYGSLQLPMARPTLTKLL
jgi:hypothetical protein